MNIYIRTSDPARNVLVPRRGDIRIVAAQPATAFNLTNTLRPAAIAEARAVAAEAGLTLRDAKRVAVTH